MKEVVGFIYVRRDFVVWQTRPTTHSCTSHRPRGSRCKLLVVVLCGLAVPLIAVTASLCSPLTNKVDAIHRMEIAVSSSDGIR